MDALNAGKHVLVEKPLATTVQECKDILAARDASGTILMVDFHNHWNIPFMQVKEMVDTGELGDLRMINVRLNDTIYVPTKMLNWASRRWISGAEIKRVYSVSRAEVLRKKGIDTPDFYQSILELSNGATAYVENCWIVAENAPNIFEFKGDFIGSKGSTFVNVSHHRMIEKYTEKGAGFSDVVGVVDRYGKALGFCTASIEHFIDCILQNASPIVTGEDGLVATQVVQAMEESASTGLPVDLQSVIG
jgi:predicted dehydrogenase